MSEYTISQPTKADAQGLGTMHEKSWLDAYPSEENSVSQKWVAERASGFSTKKGIEKRRAYIQESHDNPDYFLRIAKDENDKVIGFVDARRGETIELRGLYIDSTAYGSGLARKLAEPALEWLGKQNDITVTVVSYNQRAIKFYEKLGFIKQPDTDRLYKDTPMHVVDMIRKGEA